MNKEKCVELHKELDSLIMKFCEEHNLTFKQNCCHYDDNNMSYKCEIFENDANGSVRENSFDLQIANNWLKETGYTYDQVKGKCFKTERGWAKIVRFQYGTKFPWIIEDHPVNARRNAKPYVRVNQAYLLNFKEITAPF